MQTLIVTLLAASGLGWGALSWWSRAEDGLSVWWLLTVLGFEWAVFGGLISSAASRSGLGVRFIWITAIFLRIPGLFALPVFEDDHHRFLWDGHVFAHTGNPYATVPADWFDDATVPDEFQEVLDQVNYPEVPTIYGPLTELGFLASCLTAPGKLWPWKVWLIAADLALVFALQRLAGKDAPLRPMAFMAWCPLSIFETSFNAHPDALAVALLLGAILAGTQGRRLWLGTLCGAAMGAKVFALLLVPFLLWRARWQAWLASALTLLGLYLPFWLQGSAADLAGLRVFAQDWEFNSSGYALLAWSLGPTPARMAAAALFAAVWLAVFVHFSRSGRPANLIPGRFIFASFFLLSPTFNPWYALWLLPFVALRPSPFGIALLATVCLGYLTELNLGRAVLDGFAHPAWVRPLEFGLIALAGLLELRQHWPAQGETATKST